EAQNVMVWQKDNSQPTQPASSQVQNIMVAHGNNGQSSQSGTNSSALMKRAETNIGASLRASQLHSSISPSLSKIKAQDWFQTSSKQGATPGPSTAAVAPHLVYNGGKVLKNPSVTNIYYGGYWNTTAGKGDSTYTDSF